MRKVVILLMPFLFAGILLCFVVPARAQIPTQTPTPKYEVPTPAGGPQGAEGLLCPAEGVVTDTSRLDFEYYLRCKECFQAAQATSPFPTVIIPTVPGFGTPTPIITITPTALPTATGIPTISPTPTQVPTYYFVDVYPNVTVGASGINRELQFTWNNNSSSQIMDAVAIQGLEGGYRLNNNSGSWGQIVDGGDYQGTDQDTGWRCWGTSAACSFLGQSVQEASRWLGGSNGLTGRTDWGFRVYKSNYTWPMIARVRVVYRYDNNGPSNKSTELMPFGIITSTVRTADMVEGNNGYWFERHYRFPVMPGGTSGDGYIQKAVAWTSSGTYLRNEFSGWAPTFWCEGNCEGDVNWTAGPKCAGSFAACMFAGQMPNAGMGYKYDIHPTLMGGNSYTAFKNLKIGSYADSVSQFTVVYYKFKSAGPVTGAPTPTPTPTVQPTSTVNPAVTPTPDGLIDCRTPVYRDTSPAVEYGGTEYIGSTCPVSLTSISYTFPAIGPLPDIPLNFPGFGICVDWYSFPAMEVLGHTIPVSVILLPLAMMALLWVMRV